MRNNVNVPVVHPVSADVMWKMNDRVFNGISFTVFMQHCQKISHTPEGKKINKQTRNIPELTEIYLWVTVRWFKFFFIYKTVLII